MPSTWPTKSQNKERRSRSVSRRIYDISLSVASCLRAITIKFKSIHSSIGNGQITDNMLSTAERTHGRTGRRGRQPPPPPVCWAIKGFTVRQYWLIIKINVTNSVNFVGNSVNFVGNILSNRNFS
jgi:hypothetical protein